MTLILFYYAIIGMLVTLTMDAIDEAKANSKNAYHLIMDYNYVSNGDKLFACLAMIFAYPVILVLLKMSGHKFFNWI